MIPVASRIPTGFCRNANPTSFSGQQNPSNPNDFSGKQNPNGPHGFDENQNRKCVWKKQNLNDSHVKFCRKRYPYGFNEKQDPTDECGKRNPYGLPEN